MCCDKEIFIFMQYRDTVLTVRKKKNAHECGYQDVCQLSLFFNVAKIFLLYLFINVLKSWATKYRLEEEKVWRRYSKLSPSTYGRI